MDVIELSPAKKMSNDQTKDNGLGPKFGMCTGEKENRFTAAGVSSKQDLQAKVP
jgi:hypothetical protein